MHYPDSHDDRKKHRLARIPDFRNYELGQWFLYCPNEDCPDPRDGSANAQGPSYCDVCGALKRVWVREEADENLTAAEP